jgi:hypothetical protein
MASWVAGLLLASCCGVLCLFLAGVWDTMGPVVREVVGGFLASARESRPFLSKDEAATFWGRSRFVRLLFGGVWLVGWLPVAYACGWALERWFVVCVGGGVAVFGCVVAITEIRLMRSRRAGGWG